MASATATIVTAYYKFKSKHSAAAYDTWMARFLGTVQTPMVIFTGDESTAQQIAQHRVQWMAHTKIIILPMHQLTCAAPEFQIYWDRDIVRDPERHHHTKELYILWNEKSAFIRRAIADNPFKTDYFAWCDMGVCRRPNGNEVYRDWPNPSKLATLDRSKIHVLQIHPFEVSEIEIEIQKKQCSLPCFNGKDRIGGTMMIGSRDAWRRWIPLYFETLCDYMRADYFAGKDQSIMSTMACIYPDLVACIPPQPYNQDDERGDNWFYLLHYFA